MIPNLLVKYIKITKYANFKLYWLLPLTQSPPHINEIKNSYIFDPCDVDGALNVYKEIKFDIYKNSEFIQKYLRSNISKQMVESIKKLNEKH